MIGNDTLTTVLHAGIWMAADLIPRMDSCPSHWPRRATRVSPYRGGS